MRPEPLANPERHWTRAARTTNVTVAEVEACLGERVEEPLHLLSGGLANTNVRVGDRVVRIYRRDPKAAAREAALLTRPWTTFRVPKVLRAGEGFLVLEHVAHGPLLDDAVRGAAIGRALAEIHAVRFDVTGDLDAALRVVEPFGDLVGALLAYTRDTLDGPLRDRVIRALEAVAPALRDAVGPPVLVHADFKVSNLHWTTDDRLLVLDWEFAYAGSALSDIGQLLRWEPSPAFTAALAAAYGPLVDDWSRWAAALDVVNLAGLLANQKDVEGSARVADVTRRIEKTLARL